MTTKAKAPEKLFGGAIPVEPLTPASPADPLAGNSPLGSPPPAPIAEDGSTTSENFWIKALVIIDHAALVLLVGAEKAGLLHVGDPMIVFAGLTVETINGAAISVYALSRGIRKQGTQG